MHNAQDNAQCALRNAQRTMHNRLLSIHCNARNNAWRPSAAHQYYAHSLMHNTQGPPSTMHKAQCVSHNLETIHGGLRPPTSTLHSMQCTMYNALYTIHNAQLPPHSQSHSIICMMPRVCSLYFHKLIGIAIRNCAIFNNLMRFSVHSTKE